MGQGPLEEQSAAAWHIRSGLKQFCRGDPDIAAMDALLAGKPAVADQIGEVGKAAETAGPAGPESPARPNTNPRRSPDAPARQVR